MLEAQVSHRRGRKPPRAVARAVLTVLAALLVSGLLSMHALVGFSAAADGDGTLPAGGDRAAVSDPGAAHGVAAQEGSTAAGGEHGARHDAAHGHLLAGVCLALIGGLLWYAVVAARTLGWSGRVRDVVAARSTSWSARLRTPGRPDLHALSILRC